MSADNHLPQIAILVTPESAASVVYGMFDLFKSAGRDWPMVVAANPAPRSSIR